MISDQLAIECLKRENLRLARSLQMLSEWSEERERILSKIDENLRKLSALNGSEELWLQTA